MIAEDLSDDPEPEPGHRPEISLQNPNAYPEARAGGLRRWLESVLEEVAPQAESFAVRFVGDRAMRRLNHEFRGRDAVTDVLSFAGETTPEGFHLGDVVISVPAARRQAAERGADPEREIRILLLHGVLHCLGFDHESDDGEMVALESKLRRRWLESPG